ncbi:MAG: hypothetical protein JF606_11295 [Burkholderiales bacterium]|jgi:hypothetical protein|nr:hypothetical protein [Burkholderiales bacterium]
MNLPSLERLSCDVGREHALLAGDREPVAVELRSATKGVPMNARHCCYAAEFALPAGVRFEQANYTLVAGDDTWPDLLMTPIGPDEDGRQLMQVVFHYPIPQTTVACPPEV